MDSLTQLCGFGTQLSSDFCLLKTFVFENTHRTILDNLDNNVSAFWVLACFLTVASCTSDSWEQMLDLPKMDNLPDVHLSLQTHQQNLSRVSSHILKLRVPTRAVDVSNQSSKTSVTKSCPLWICSCKLLHIPKNVKSSTNTSILRQLVGILFVKSPIDSNSPFLKGWSYKQRVTHLPDDLQRHETKRLIVRSNFPSQKTFQLLWRDL